MHSVWWPLWKKFWSMCWDSKIQEWHLFLSFVDVIGLFWQQKIILRINYYQHSSYIFCWDWNLSKPEFISDLSLCPPSGFIYYRETGERQTNRNKTKDDKQFLLSPDFPKRAIFSIYENWVTKLYKVLCIWLDSTPSLPTPPKKKRKSQMQKHRTAVCWQRRLPTVYSHTLTQPHTSPQSSLHSSWFDGCRFPQGPTELTLWCNSGREPMGWGGSKYGGNASAHTDASSLIPCGDGTEGKVTLQTAAWSTASKPPSGASRFRDTLCFRTSSLKLSTLSVRGSRWRNPKEGTQFGNSL